MDAVYSTSPVITRTDRLALTLCLAIIVHAAVILGISFDLEDQPSLPQTLEVILVQKRSQQEPEKVDYLAQTNLDGGGDSGAMERPAAPLSSPFPELEPEIASSPSIASLPVPEQDPVQLTETLSAPPPHVEQPAQGAADRLNEQLVRETAQARQRLSRSGAEPARKPLEKLDSETAELTPESNIPSAATLMANAFAIASLNTEIQQRLAMQAKRPRHKFISSKTREYKYAAYMEAWRAKVERVGNLNYPDKARRNKITGSLLLDVVIKPDGEVQEMTVRRSSGHAILDQAALKIVNLAAPFAPFPDDLREETDLLHITRTWQFTHQFTSK